MSGTAAVVTSPDAVTGGNAAWDYAVPLGQEQNDRRTSNESSNTHAKSSYRHRTPNGYPRSRNSSQPGSRRGSNAHDSHSRDIGPALNRQLGDAQSNGQPRKSESSAKGPGVNTVDNWIHRDKLARIESEELQQAAMRIQRQVHTGSKSSSMRGRSHDSHSLNGAVTTPPEQTDSWQRNQLDSPIPLEDYGENEIESERMTWDLRRPEEIAAASSSPGGDHKGPGLKKSSSRIPVLASSPHRASPDDGDYEFFDMQRPRTRTMGSGDEDGTYFSHSRRNSESAVIDSPDASPKPAANNNNTTPPFATTSSRPSSRGNPLGQASPTRKTPAKGTSTTRKSSAPPNNRKASSSGAKSRTASSSNANKEQRPTTRSGETRPSTAVNRPEGDPPWLATMYKPDPRLPPDQQILPTHAKKMQQEQWAREGKTPTAYDREFAPLAIRPDDPPPPPAESEKPTPSLPVESHEFTHAWPLQSSRSPEPGRPGTSGTNYSTMPKLQTPPPAVLSVSQKLQPNFPPPPPEEPEKVEKGCGCCVVM